MKNLFIDSSTLTQITIIIYHLKVLKPIDNSDQLNNNKTRSANFRFQIRNTNLIELIELNISLKLIIFHIIPVNTSFLFYLANIDEYRDFFNNIIN